jgi:hypothetical protein
MNTINRHLVRSRTWAKARQSTTRPTFSHRFQSNNRAPASSSIINSANDYFSSLRWKAANALTSSLPEEERSQLLEQVSKANPLVDEKFEEKEEEEESTVPQLSIDEIVAATRAQEVESHRQRWETEKGKLMAEAEEAARKRVETDLMIQKRQLAFELWKKDLEREKNDDSFETITQEKTSKKLGEHPVLGPVLVDLGSKRIHVVSAQSLAAIPVWKKQRIYRHSRAKNMASDKMKTLHLGLPGIIGIYERSDGHLSIIDGQHRVGMLKELQEKASSSPSFDFQKILVEVYPQPDDLDEAKHSKDIFLEVNKAEPVKLVDLPGVAKSSHRKIINETAQLIIEQYPAMFSHSQRCRVPHLNEDNLRDALFASKVIDRHSIRSSKQMIKWMMEQNDFMAEKFEKDADAKQLVSVNALKKADKHKFYLGLGMDWLYN